jgi:hypothetical protein
LAERPTSSRSPTLEHFPISKRDGGRKAVDNAILAHRLCNRLDYSITSGRPHKRDLERIRKAREAAIRRKRDIPRAAAGQTMTKRSTFTAAEIAEIKRLVREKQTAAGDRQKTLRAKLRKLGFFISDYADEPGFVESDVDDLIRRGTITVTDTD